MLRQPLSTIAVVSLAFLAFASAQCAGGRGAESWQREAWMKADPELPAARPRRVLAMTDLPPLKEMPTAEDFTNAIAKSTEAGCSGAVLTFSWPSLEPSEGVFTLEDLKGAVLVNSGRTLYLGIQVLNTTVLELPADLQGKRLDDHEVLARFKVLLDGLGPLLENRVRYLSIGNESDVYLALNPRDRRAFRTFLESASAYAKRIAPDLLVGTTVTDEGARATSYKSLVRKCDAHFLTYYHGQTGVDGEFKDVADTKTELLALLGQLDERPVIFQEIGFPAHQALSSPQEQATFVAGVFDAWDEVGGRIPFLNYFMMYDFTEEFIEPQLDYYGVTEGVERLSQFLTSLGLHTADGTPRPGWKVFGERGRAVRSAKL